MISHLNVFAFIFCGDLVTPESLWRHKGVAMHVTYKTMHRFPQCMIRHLPLRKIAYKFRHHNVPTPNNSCYNRILAWCIVHCEIGGTQGPLGYVNALGATRLVHWLILVAPSCLRSHNTRYIMLKSLNIFQILQIIMYCVALLCSLIQLDARQIVTLICIISHWDIICVLLIASFWHEYKLKHTQNIHAAYVTVVLNIP